MQPNGRPKLSESSLSQICNVRVTNFVRWYIQPSNIKFHLECICTRHSFFTTARYMRRMKSIQGQIYCKRTKSPLKITCCSFISSDRFHVFSYGRGWVVARAAQAAEQKAQKLVPKPRFPGHENFRNSDFF